MKTKQDAHVRQKLTSVVNYGTLFINVFLVCNILYNLLRSHQLLCFCVRDLKACGGNAKQSKVVQNDGSFFLVISLNAHKEVSVQDKMLTKLVLHGHNDLHLVQTVQTQVFHEVGGRLQLCCRM